MLLSLEVLSCTDLEEYRKKNVGLYKGFEKRRGYTVDEIIQSSGVLRIGRE